MKKISKFLSAVALSAALCVSSAGAAFADDSTVTFENRNEVFTFAPGSEWTASDLFDGFKGVMPGDKLTEEVTISNESAETVRIYMHAAPHGVDNALSDSVAAAETVESMREFLSVFSMRVYNGSQLIYGGVPDSASNGLEAPVLLGEFAPGDEAVLRVELEADIDKMTDDYANRVGEVDWVFTVEEVPEPLPETGGDRSLSQTGDDMPIIALAVAVVAAACILFVAVFALRRSRR